MPYRSNSFASSSTSTNKTEIALAQVIAVPLSIHSPFDNTLNKKISSKPCQNDLIKLNWAINLGSKKDKSITLAYLKYCRLSYARGLHKTILHRNFLTFAALLADPFKDVYVGKAKVYFSLNSMTTFGSISSGIVNNMNTNIEGAP